MDLKVKNKNIIYIIPFQNIKYCKAEGNYTCFVMKDKEILAYQPLKKTIESLSNHNFCRCHNSFIVNLNEVSEFNLKENVLLLKDRIKVPVSVRKRKKLLKAMKKFIADQG